MANHTWYARELDEMAEGLNDLMADFEDLREEILEEQEGQASPQGAEAVARIDAALKLLDQAAGILEGDPFPPALG